MSEQAIRVLKTLRKYLGEHFLQGGLQSMTAKQFVEIIKLFAQNICGDKFVIQENNVDDVKRFVDFMEYPHQMNKSWFKAPTVSIAFDRNVEFMDWLCDFMSTDARVADFVENEDNVDESNIFPNQEYICTFLRDVKTGFGRWNDQSSGYEVRFEEWKMQTTNKLIDKKIQVNDITASINQLKSEYEILLKKESLFGNDNLLVAQQEKSDELKVELTKLKVAVDEKDFEYQETCRELNEFLGKNTELKSTVNELKVTIENQPTSADDRHKIATELEQKEHFAQEKRMIVNLQKSLADDNQLKIARLKKQKVSKVFAFNALVQKLFQHANHFDDITINQLALHEKDTKDRIAEVLQLFRKIKDVIDKRRIDLHASLNETQTKLSSISNELFKVEDELSAQKKQLHTLEVQMQKYENEIVDLKYDAEQQQQLLQTQINNLMDKGEQIEMKIANCENVHEALKVENKKIYQGIELKGNALLKVIEARSARRGEAIAELESVTKQLTEAVKKLK